MKTSHLLLTMCCMMALSFSSLAQTTVIDFDNAGNWTAGSGTITSYQTDHSFTESNWTFTGGPALRQGNGAQDGYAAANGTYSWRLRDQAGDWTATYNTSGTLTAFGFANRRWDSSPAASRTVSYSTDGGSNYTTVGTLTYSTSDWSTFSYSLPSPVAVSAGDFVVKITYNSGERVMIDDFSFTLGSVSSPSISASPTTYDFGTVTTGNTSTQSFSVVTSNLSANVSVTGGSSTFELSSDNSTFGNSATIAQAGGTLYIRFSPAAASSYGPDNIILTSGSATDTIVVQGTGQAPAALGPGDIVFTSVNADSTKDFSFVVLTDIVGSETVYFTDDGWISGAFRGSEGILTWTTPVAGITCGTEVFVTDPISGSRNISKGSISASGSFNPSGSGDQILAYMGSSGSPSFVAAINWANSGWSNTSSTNNSEVPTGLTDGSTAIYVGNMDDYKYNNCASLASAVGQAAIITELSNTVYWAGDNTTAFIGGSGCTFNCTTPTNTTYTWQVTTGTADWTTATNWSPTRTTPANTDILVFDQGGSSMATNVPDEDVLQINVSNNTSIALRPETGATRTLNISGGSGTDFSVATGSSFIIDGDVALEVNILAGATGIVNGNVTLRNTVNSIARDHRLNANDASGLSFESGSVFTAQDLNGSPFGTSGNQLTTIFKSGSTYILQDGANPFGMNQPSSKVQFQTGSLYKHESTNAPSLIGRTYGDFEFDVAGAVVNGVGSNSGTWTVDNLTVTNGTINFYLHVNNLPLDIDVKGDMSVASGATFSYSPNQSSAESTLKFSGSSTQHISGSGMVFFGVNAVLETANDLTLQNDVDVQGTVKLTSGTLSTNSKVLTLVSDAAGTGLILPGSGSVSGDVTMQRYVAGGNGYRYFSPPFVDASIVDINDDVTLVGFAGTSNPGAFPNFYYYDETIPDQDSMVGWSTPTTLSAGYILGVQTGYAMYMGGNRTVDLTGTVNTGTLNKSVTNVSSGRPSNDGWNLVGNPYPSPLNWDVVAAGLPTEINDAIYYWDPVGEQYASYVNGSGTNGGTKQVSSMQGFFIKVNTTGSYSLPMTNAARMGGNPGFFRTSAPYNEALSVKVQSTTGYTDETVVRFSNDGTDNFDKSFDAYKRFTTSRNAPSLWTNSQVAGTNYSINTLHALNTEVSVPLNLVVMADGVYTISMDDLSSFDATAMIYLEDKQAQVMFDVRQHPTYSFNALTTDANDRFELHFYPPMQISTTTESCDGNDGSILLDQPGTTVWDVNISQNGQTIATLPGFNGSQTIDNLPEGQYTLTLQHGSGYTVTKNIIVQGVQAVEAEFSNTNTAVVGESVNFNNLSAGANSYNWNFGDGYTAADANPAHVFQYPGEYTIELTASSDDCIDNSYGTLKVSDVSSGIGTSETNDIKAYAYSKTVVVSFTGQFSSNARIALYDLTGRLIAEQTQVTASGNQQVQLNNIVSGPYLVKITTAEKSLVQKLFVPVN